MALAAKHRSIITIMGIFMLHMPGVSYKGDFLPLSSHEKIICDKLKNHIEFFALTLGERNILHKKNLQAASDYITEQFKKTNMNVRDQPFDDNSGYVKNIIMEKQGGEKQNEIIVIGAHYDSVTGSPGADDNASGVAAILVLAELLKEIALPRTIRLVAFVNEEPPFFYTHKMGSWHYAHASYQNKENIIGMASIESIGYYSEENNTQHYPFPFQFFYPNKGNFIGFVGNMKSRTLVHAAISSFRKHTCFPSEGAALPWWIPGVAWSDQWSFWKHGYEAIMITATAPYRNPYYHTKNDLPKYLDYPRIARVVMGLFKVIIDLARHYK